jgi:hypothetical protein
MLKVGIIVRRTCKQCGKEFEFGYRRRPTSGAVFQLSALRYACG